MEKTFEQLDQKEQNKIINDINKFFRRESIYRQLQVSTKFLLPHKKYLKLELNIGSGSYYDGKRVVIGLPNYMLTKPRKEIFSALKAIHGHECEHGNSSDLVVLEKYLNEVSTYLCQKYNFHRDIAEKVGHYVQNSIEDGRIEKRLVNRLKGFLKHIKYFRGMWWRAQPVQGESEVSDFLFAICTVATTGLYPLDWEKYYKGSRAEEMLEKIRPLIMKGINDASHQTCCNHCKDIIEIIGDYIAELLQDQNMTAHLMQMAIDNDYSTSESNQSEQPSDGNSTSTHFRPEKSKMKQEKKQKKDKDEGQQQGGQGQSSEEESQDKQQEGQSSSQSKSSKKEDKKDKNSQGSSKAKNNADDKDENKEGQGAGEGEENKNKQEEKDNNFSSSGSKSSDEDADKDNEDENQTGNSSNDDQEEDGEGEGTGEGKDNVEEEGEDNSDGDNEDNSNNTEGENEEVEAQNSNEGEDDKEKSDNEDEPDGEEEGRDSNNQSNTNNSKNDQDNDQDSDNDQTNVGCDADFVDQELDKIRQDALEEAERALSNADKEDEQEAKKQVKLAEEDKANTITPEELDKIAKEYKDDYKPYLEVENFNSSQSVELAMELKKEAKKFKKEVEDIFKNKKVFNSRHQRRGVLDTTSLWQLGVKDYNVFSKKGNPQNTDYVIYILMDGSGSMTQRVDMNTSKWFYASKAGAIIEEGIKEFIPFKIATFAGGYNNNTHYIVSNFQEKGKENKAWSFYHYYKPNNGNKDGHSIRVATKELMNRHEKNKLLIVLSDGLPSAYISQQRGQADVRDAVRDARKNGVKVVSICFGNEAHREYTMDVYKAMYQTSIISCDPKNISSELIRVLKREIIK